MRPDGACQERGGEGRGLSCQGGENLQERREMHPFFEGSRLLSASSSLLSLQPLLLLFLPSSTAAEWQRRMIGSPYHKSLSLQQSIFLTVGIELKIRWRDEQQNLRESKVNVKTKAL